MLADYASPPDLLLLSRDALALVSSLLHDDWRAEALRLLDDRNWRLQLVACAALVLSGGDDATEVGVWRALDQGSWIAPQLVATAFLLDAEFVARAEERLLDVRPRAPKAIGALVRAYHRLPQPRMNVLAQLTRHDRVLQTEEARIGIRGVDRWLDQLPAICDAETQSRWRRQPRAA